MLPNNVAGWENPLDLILRQNSAVQSKMIPQMILMHGVLVDVFRATRNHGVDKVYGSFAGQKLESKSQLRTRVLGLSPQAFRTSKRSSISGSLEGGWCFANTSDNLESDDVLVESSTQAKWIVVQPQVIGTAGGRNVWRFRVSTMFE